MDRRTEKFWRLNQRHRQLAVQERRALNRLNGPKASKIADEMRAVRQRIAKIPRAMLACLALLVLGGCLQDPHACSPPQAIIHDLAGDWTAVQEQWAQNAVHRGDPFPLTFDAGGSVFEDGEHCGEWWAVGRILVIEKPCRTRGSLDAEVCGDRAWLTHGIDYPQHSSFDLARRSSR
uniref:Uncharacterized protein n=1 Tax=viral metagenome TaxID=1070528 RepID=A0A6M3M7X6_9ZZZZ